MALVVLIVWVGIGYGAILVLEFFGVDGLRDAEGTATGAGTYVYWLAAPALVVGAAVLALLATVVAAVVSPRVRIWWTTPEPARTAGGSAPRSAAMSTAPHHQHVHSPAGDDGDDGDDDDAFDDDSDLDARRPMDGVQEFDVCPSCGNLIEVLRGRLECLACGQRFD